MLRLEYRTQIDSPVDVVWAFHERDDAIDLLNPGVRVVQRKGKLGTGSRVELRVPIGPFRVRWLALHVDHEEGVYFVDEQIRGPFRYWKHEHRFEPVEGGTLLLDRIQCSLPLGPVSDWLLGWAVKIRVGAMFRRRHRVTKQWCEQEAPKERVS